jgi:hypothetical protein
MTSSSQRCTASTVVRPAEEAFCFRVLSLHPGGTGVTESAAHRIERKKHQRVVGRWLPHTRTTQSLASHRVSTCEHIAMIQSKTLRGCGGWQQIGVDSR